MHVSCCTFVIFRFFRGRVNREVQTVNWKKRAVETGVKSGLKKAHKPWIRGRKRRTNRELGWGVLPWSANRELGTFSLENSSVSVHSLHFMVCAPLIFVLKRIRGAMVLKWCRRSTCADSSHRNRKKPACKNVKGKKLLKTSRKKKCSQKRKIRRFLRRKKRSLLAGF